MDHHTRVIPGSYPGESVFISVQFDVVVVFVFAGENEQDCFLDGKYWWVKIFFVSLLKLNSMYCVLHLGTIETDPSTQTSLSSTSVQFSSAFNLELANTSDSKQSFNCNYFTCLVSVSSN